jgi:hypothetical protein
MANPGDPYGVDGTMVYGSDGVTPVKKPTPISANPDKPPSQIYDNTQYNWAATSPNGSGYSTQGGLIGYGMGTGGINDAINWNQTGNGAVQGNPVAGQLGNYIDPTNGKIWETQGTVTPGVSNMATQMANGARETSYEYSPTTDYGLGPDALGVIPISRNAQGQATAFYAGTPGGGGQVFKDQASAVASASAYQSWYATQHPAPAPASSGPASAGPASAATASTPTNPANDLTLPGAGEQFQASTTGAYTQPTNAQKTFDSTANQPTNAEQQWNAYSGVFNNPNYLKDYYQTQENEADNALQSRLSSGGIADSSAGARATAGVPLQYSQAALAGMQQFAQTGMGMASAADSANTAKTAQRTTAASSADSSNLSAITAGQNAADQAQQLGLNRVQGGITSAANLGGAMASTAIGGLTPEMSGQLTTSLSGIQAKVASNQLTAQAAYQQAQALLQGLGGLASGLAIVSKSTGKPITAAQAASTPATDWTFGNTSPFAPGG